MGGLDDKAFRLRGDLWRDNRTLIGASDAGAHLDYAGYILFPASGLMRLTVTKAGKPSGQSVILVPPPT